MLLCEMLLEFSQLVLSLPCNVCISVTSLIVTWSTRYCYEDCDTSFYVSSSWFRSSGFGVSHLEGLVWNFI